MKKLLFSAPRKISEGIIAGLMISIGGTVYLSCYNGANQISTFVGALFFCVALLCICVKGYSLYTGKIGYILSDHDKESVAVMIFGLIGNIIATVGLGYLIAAALPTVSASAAVVVAAKREQQLWGSLVRAVLCGVLVYLAVDIYRENKSVLGVIFCIPTFILCGFEHSIADIFYFSAAGFKEWHDLLFLLVIVVGNSIGALIIPLLRLKRRDKKQSSDNEKN